MLIGGLGYSLAWALAPFDHAKIVSVVILGASVVILLARYAWTIGTRERGQPSA